MKLYASIVLRCLNSFYWLQQQFTTIEFTPRAHRVLKYANFFGVRWEKRTENKEMEIGSLCNDSP